MKYNSLSFEELKKLCIQREIPIEFIDQNKKSFITILKRYDQFDKIIQKNGYDKLNLLELRLIMVEKDIYISGFSKQQIMYHLAATVFVRKQNERRDAKEKREQKKFMEKTDFLVRQSSKYHTYDDIDFKLPNKKHAKKLIQPLLIEKEQAELGNFPNNIEHVYWASKEEIPYESGTYDLFCKLTNGNYVFFEDYDCYSWCGDEDDYSGKIYVSSNPENIFKYAMGKDIYKQYIKETK
jgi:hypothetical protein